MSTKKSKKTSGEPSLKSFADHLGELRGRLAWVALVFIVTSSLAYNVRDTLVSVVLSPIGHQKLVYLTPAGGFAFIFQVTMYAGMLAAAPLAVYHLYRFVSPALPEHMRKMSLRVVLASTVLLCVGVAFGYFVAIPAALQFLTTFAGDFVEANLTADSYLNFFSAYIMGLGLMFQLPLFLVFWNWINPFKPGGLLATQRYVLVGSFIAAALITPTPDVINQCLIAVPIVGIYQLGVAAVFMMNRKRRRSEKKLTQPALEKPVMMNTPRLANNFSTMPKPRFSAPVIPSVAAEPKPVLSVQQAPSAMPVKPQQKGKGAFIDGFTRSRPSSLDVPHRRPQYVRPPAPSRQMTPLPRTNVQSSSKSIDGFSFA